MLNENEAVEFKGVDFYYGNLQALFEICFKVPKGCIMGMIGPNGSGKSTTLNLLTTRLIPAKGSIEVLGKQTLLHPMEVRKNLGYAPEESTLFQGLTAREFLDISGRLYGMETAHIAERSENLLELFELTSKSDHQIGSYSKGMKRKTLLASAMLHHPEILVLDEPMEGLDVFAQQTLKTQLMKLRDKGKTIIYSTHTLEIVEQLCDCVCLLEGGRVIGHGDIQKVKEDLKVSELFRAFTRVSSP